MLRLVELPASPNVVPSAPLRCRLHEVADETEWRFADDELFSVESDALDVHVDLADRRLTLRGELVSSSVETLADLVSLLTEAKRRNHLTRPH